MSIRSTKLILFSLTITFLALIISSCATAPVKYAELNEAIEVPQGTDSVPLAFNKIIVKLRRLEEIGEAYGGILCVPNTKLEWQGGRVNITTEDFTEIFRDELLKANYPIVGNPNALFDDPELSKAELLVAGMINDLELNICYPNSGFGDFSTAKGGAYMKVDWQIYSLLDRSVIFNTTSEGSFELDESRRDGLFNIMSTSFANATQNLLADTGFYNLVVRPKDFAEVQNFQVISYGKLSKLSKSFNDNTERLSSAVVTVRASTGHGSGVFIGNKGYVITNQHVVGESKFVKLILSTGREITGEVLRTDKARDLALIITGEKRIGLPFQTKIPNIGQDVFAIGSPLSEENSYTVSKGIISAIRTLDRGFEVIQSDVMVQPGSSGGPLVDINGNIIGITVSGMVRGGSSVGINYFIPVYDIPKYLGLTDLDITNTQYTATNNQTNNSSSEEERANVPEIGDLEQRLIRLKNLYDQGLISEEAYLSKQSEIIDEQ